LFVASLSALEVVDDELLDHVRPPRDDADVVVSG